MVIINRLDKPFGPAGSFAGITLFLAGLVITYFSYTGLILVVIGAFAGFTTTSAMLDLDNRQVNYSSNLFGFLPAGKWINLRPEMKIGIRKSNLGFRAYSRSNRIRDVVIKDFRICLYGADGREIMPLKKFKTMDSAISELELIGRQLGIGVI